LHGSLPGKFIIIKAFSPFLSRIKDNILEPVAKRHEEAGMQGSSERKSEAYTEVR
jgi:hypothetical protein